MNPNAEIVGIYDPDPAAMVRAVAEFDFPATHVFTNFDACMATKPDLAILCASPADHARYVDLLSAHNVHVFVEKPFAATVADARFAKPLDEDLTLRLARHHEALITVEEGAVGGFGSHIAQLLAERGVFDRGLKYRSMVLPDIFIDQASPEAMYRVAGMEAAQIEARVLEVLGVAVVGMRG